MAKGDGWTTLGELEPGTLFEGVNGRKAVRSSSTSDHGDYITTVTLDDGHMARDRANLIVRPLPSPLSDEDREQARLELAAILHQMRTPAAVRRAGTYSDPDEWTSPDLHAPGQIMTLPPAATSEMPAPYDPAGHLSRLLWLLGLPRELLGFVCAAAQDPADAVTIAAFSDWLKEHQCEADGEAMKQDWRERLMELVAQIDVDSRQEGFAYAMKRGPDAQQSQEAVYAGLKAVRKLIGLPEGG